MTAHATGSHAAARAAIGPAEPIAPEFVVTVRDDVDERIAGHAGGAYTSPPQPRADALALIGLLVGGPVPSDGRERWTRPVPGGRRTIALTHHLERRSRSRGQGPDVPSRARLAPRDPVPGSSDQRPGATPCTTTRT